MSTKVTSTATSIIASIASSSTATTPPNSRDGIPLHIQEYQDRMRESFLSMFTPLNGTLFLLSLYALYRLLATTNEPIKLPSGPAPIVFRTFTPRTLLPYNGTKSTMNPDGSVYLSVKGKVHDVSSGRNFYGPGGPYENFAGRDATRGLACQSFDEEMLTKNLDGPLDPCKDLTPDQLENLNGWVERFDEKYLVVGKLVAFKETDFH